MHSRVSFTAQELRATMQHLATLFDVVRLVDPHNTAVLQLEPTGTLTVLPESCFCIWGKNSRCKNCVSICSAIDGSRRTKLELMGECDPFLVVSCPIELQKDAGPVEIVLEMVMPAADSLLLADGENRPLKIQLSDAYDRIYGDILTKAYNRRYLEEFNFLYHNASTICQEVCFLVVDVKRFKHFNDLYGHMAGDEVLRQLAALLHRSVREQDSVVRMGGDEFVLTLIGCKPADARAKGEELKGSIKSMRLDCIGGEPVEVDVGCAHTPWLETSADQLAALLQAADEDMCRDKNQSDESPDV